MLSVSAFDELIMLWIMHEKVQNVVRLCQTGVLLGSFKSTEWGESNGTSRRAHGRVEGTQTLTLCQSSKCPKWAQRRQVSIWESGGEVGDGAGKQMIECEMGTKNDKEGRG
jgi:hypothetical protein